ncbi:MAG: hypothetical protein ABWY56_07615 [Propionibacteriaceae bacterium]
MTPPRDAANRSGIDVALAEFAALRAEIGTAQTAQNACVGIGVTSVGVLWTVSVQGSDPRLLLATPAIALVACILFLAEAHRMFKIGDYIRQELWPYLTRTTSYQGSWEHHAHVTHGRWTVRRAAIGILFDGVVPILFTALGVGSLLYTHLRHDALWAWGWVMVGLTLVIPVVYGLHRMKIARVPRSRPHD